MGLSFEIDPGQSHFNLRTCAFQVRRVAKLWPCEVACPDVSQHAEGILNATDEGSLRRLVSALSLWIKKLRPQRAGKSNAIEVVAVWSPSLGRRRQLCR
jgi:hypothetical protein